MKQEKRKKLKLKKGEKRKIARKLRAFIGTPARTICRTTKNAVMVELLNDLETGKIQI